MSLVKIVFPMPATLKETVQTIRLMSKLGISYHFDDPAVECLAENYQGRPDPAPLTITEARHIQRVVDRMRTVCDAKGYDIFEILIAAEVENDRGMEWGKDIKPEIKELFA